MKWDDKTAMGAIQKPTSRGRKGGGGGGTTATESGVNMVHWRGVHGGKRFAIRYLGYLEVSYTVSVHHATCLGGGCCRGKSYPERSAAKLPRLPAALTGPSKEYGLWTMTAAGS